jgi:hypothetical protein
MFWPFGRDRSSLTIESYKALDEAFLAILGPTPAFGEWTAADGYDLAKIEGWKSGTDKVMAWTPSDAHDHAFLVGRLANGYWYERCRCGRGVQVAHLRYVAEKWPHGKYPHAFIKLGTAYTRKEYGDVK